MQVITFKGAVYVVADSEQEKQELSARGIHSSVKPENKGGEENEVVI